MTPPAGTGDPGRPEPEATPDQRRAAASRTDSNVTLDRDDDDWAWRRRIRANPTAHLAYRIVVFVVGLIVVVGGLALVPLPGPGWLVVFLGLAIWASEFERAQAVLRWVRGTVHAWNQWLKRQNLLVQALTVLATAALVIGFFWLVFKISGVPGFLPDGPERWIKKFV